uniref:Uncharacterized protein n=1 Tax=Solanum lycopersicum TaxID=4081 RepID=A0A3Q7IUQ0_SOLLC
MNPIGKVPVLKTPDGSIFESNSEEAAVSALKRALGTLNTHLASTKYLVEHLITLADNIVVCNLSIGFRMIMTKSFTKEIPRVERYFWTVVNQQNFSKILGKVKQAKSILAVQSKKPTQLEKTKANEEPTKEVNKEEPSLVEKETTPKPKAKNPLDLLPPSKISG